MCHAVKGNEMSSLIPFSSQYRITNVESDMNFLSHLEYYLTRLKIYRNLLEL